MSIVLPSSRDVNGSKGGPKEISGSEILQNALKARNESWRNSRYIPSWVDIKNVDLDRFFTKPDVACKCYESLF